jgi:alcohol oxidase
MDSGLDAGIKFRPNEEDLEELGPEFRVWWEQYFVSAPDKPVVWVGVATASLVPQSAEQNSADNDLP